MRFIEDDCLSVMRKMEENSVDSVVTDPPYGFGFMGKKWDYAVPSVEAWKEALRVLKPGGHLLSFGGPRTYHRLACAIEDAGFEVRDQLQWLFGSGFLKSLNLKAILPGYGTALKPANEPILLARKPLSEKTVAKNVLKWGTGGLYINASRIGYQSESDKLSATPQGECTSQGLVGDNGKPRNSFDRPALQGRFPSNLLLDEAAAEMLDEQTGERKSGAHNGKMGKLGYHGGAEGQFSVREPSSGGASRFFYVAKASKRERNAGCEGMEERCSSKLGAGIQSNVGNGTPGESSSEDRKSQNHHPTVKPLTLMRYLVRLVTPPNGIVLDPFMGSGTTGLAAKEEGFRFIGIERESEYMKIAEARCK